MPHINRNRPQSPSRVLEDNLLHFARIKERRGGRDDTGIVICGLQQKDVYYWYVCDIGASFRTELRTLRELLKEASPSMICPYCTCYVEDDTSREVFGFMHMEEFK